jgi:hypothetical protein
MAQEQISGTSFVVFILQGEIKCLKEHVRRIYVVILLKRDFVATL